MNPAWIISGRILIDVPAVQPLREEATASLTGEALGTLLVTGLNDRQVSEALPRRRTEVEQAAASDSENLEFLLMNRAAFRTRMEHRAIRTLILSVRKMDVENRSFRKFFHLA